MNNNEFSHVLTTIMCKKQQHAGCNKLQMRTPKSRSNLRIFISIVWNINIIAIYNAVYDFSIMLRHYDY